MIDNYTNFTCSRIQGTNYNPAGVYVTRTVAS
jgi:hypothetical protein